MFRTSQPYPYRATQYDLFIDNKQNPMVHVWRYSEVGKQVKFPHGYEYRYSTIGVKLEPFFLSDFLQNPFDVLPVEYQFQKDEIIQWLRKEGYEPQTI
jgi:hypothetical protein